MVNQSKDEVVNVEHMVDRLLLFNNCLFKVGQSRTPRLDQVIRKEVLPIKQYEGLGQFIVDVGHLDLNIKHLTNVRSMADKCLLDYPALFFLINHYFKGGSLYVVKEFRTAGGLI